MKRLIFFILLTILSSSALAVTIAKTTASSLNVRSEPNGKILFSLPQNSTVGVMRIEGSRAMIMYLPENDPSRAKYGWVSSTYLKIVNAGIGSSRTRSYGVSGDNCEHEYDSGAQVCVTANDADIDCRESYDGTYYRSCEIEVEYDLSTDYEGDDYLDVSVECDVEIKYKKRDAYSWSYDSGSESESHSLYSYGSESGGMDFDFTFSSYNEVINVKIESIECEVDSVYKW